MTVLLWLAVPLVALVVGIVLAYLKNQPARPAQMQESMESFSRFRVALAEQVDVHEDEWEPRWGAEWEPRGEPPVEAPWEPPWATDREPTPEGSEGGETPTASGY